MASAFHKAECNVCNRVTWHYKEQGNQADRCTDHSELRHVNGKYTPRVRNKVDTIQGGSLYSRVDVPSERELRIANRLDRTLWRNAEVRKPATVPLTDAAALAIFADEPEPLKLDLNQVYCTFCGKPTDYIDTLTEKKPVIRKMVNTYRDEHTGEVDIRESVSSRAEVAHACKDCCLLVRKPIVVRRV